MCHEEVTQEVSKYNFFLLQYTNNYIDSQNTGQSDWWLGEATLWAKVFERNQNLSSHPLSEEGKNENKNLYLCQVDSLEGKGQRK